MALQYSDIVRERFSKPKWLGAVEQADGTGEAGNRTCGDMVKFTVRIVNDIVAEAKWQSQGCLFSIASSEQLAELANGKAVADTRKLTPSNVVKALGGVPEGKEHCAEMAVNALTAALDDAEGIEQKKAETWLKIPEAVQRKHRLEELFSEWYIPELEKLGKKVTLSSVDASGSIVMLSTSSPSIDIVMFIRETLDTYFDTPVTILFA